MNGQEAAVIAAALVGFLAGVFGTVYVLVVVDARRWGRRRRPAVSAARHGARGTLVRMCPPPAAGGTDVERGDAS